MESKNFVRARHGETIDLFWVKILAITLSAVVYHCIRDVYMENDLKA